MHDRFIFFTLMTTFALATGCGDDDDPASDGTDGSSGDGTGGTENGSATVPSMSSGADSGESSATADGSSNSGSSDSGSSNSGSSDSGSSDSGSSDSGSSDSGSSDSGSSESTGAPVCEPVGVPCEDCLITQSCCAEYSACLDDADCECFVTCLMGDLEALEDCFEPCDLQATPRAFSDIQQCAITAPCGDVCEDG